LEEFWENFVKSDPHFEIPKPDYHL